MNIHEGIFAYQVSHIFIFFQSKSKLDGEI